MRQNQPLPDLWLLSDERNDHVLEPALRRLPAGSGFVYRHYHLDDADRIARYRSLRRVCRSMGHAVVLADSAQTAREWRADGIYGAARALYPTRQGLLTIATAHDLQEIAFANRANADAVMLSPVFATNTHPGATCLGPRRFRMIAAHAQMPVIALGGMNVERAKELNWSRWAAIDGLS